MQLKNCRNRFEAETRRTLFVGRHDRGQSRPASDPTVSKSISSSVRSRRSGDDRGSPACGRLVHPLTDDDLADHTSLAEWIGGDRWIST